MKKGRNRDKAKEILLLFLPAVFLLTAVLTVFLLWEDHEEAEGRTYYRYEKIRLADTENESERLITDVDLGGGT